MVHSLLQQVIRAERRRVAITMFGAKDFGRPCCCCDRPSPSYSRVTVPGIATAKARKADVFSGTWDGTIATARQLTLPASLYSQAILSSKAMLPTLTQKTVGWFAMHLRLRHITQAGNIYPRPALPADQAYLP